MGVLSLVFANRKLVVFGLVGLLAVTAWLYVQHLRHEVETTKAALAREHQMRAAAEAQSRFNSSAVNEGDHSARIDRNSHAIITQASQEVTSAAEQLDAHRMYVAWHDGIVRVRNDTGDAIA
jgi:type II secretory pathway component PulM